MGETDFLSMKRKKLQELCKKHKIPANSTNLELANKLTQFFKEKENQTVGVSTETESSNLLMSKKVKKVRFSPESKSIEFTHKTERRRSIVLTKSSNLSVDDVNCVKELNGDSVDKPVQMRLRGGKTLIDNVGERGRKKVIVDDKPVRMRLRGGKTLIDNVGKRGRKKVIVDDKSENQVSVGNNEDRPCGMQLRGRTLKENVDSVSKRGRQRVIVDKIENQDGVGNDENGVGNRRSLRSKGIVSDGNLEIGMEVKDNGKGEEEALGETQDLLSKRRVSTLGSKMVVEGTKVIVDDKSKNRVSVGNNEDRPCGMQLRGSTLKESVDSVSKRGRKRVLVDKIDNQDGVGNNENGVGNRRSLRSKGIVSVVNLEIGMEMKDNGKGKEEALGETQDLLRRSKRRVSTLGSKMGAEVTNKVETVVQNQESVKVELRRSGRKPVLQSREQINLEPEPRSEIVDMPGRAVRTPRHKKLDRNPGSSMIETKEQFVKPCAQKNTRSKRHASHSAEVSDEIGGDDIIQRKNETRKKKKVYVSKEVVIDDSSHSTLSIIGVSDVKKLSSAMKESIILKCSLEDDVTEHREPLAAQLSVPEVTGCSKQKLLSGSTETTKLNREIQDNTIVNSIDMDENWPSRMKDVHCEKDFTEMEVKNNGKGKEEAFGETQDLLRRSKRRVSTLGGSKMDAQVTSKVETVVQNQESVKVELRRSRRKSVLPSHEQRNLEPEPRIEIVDMPGGAVRTSRRKKLDRNPGFSMIETKEQFVKPCAQKNTRSKRHASHSAEVSDEIGGDDIIQRKNETRKKKKVIVSKEVVIDDSSHSTLSIIGVSDVKKPSSTMKESIILECSLQDDVTEHREPLATQLSVPEVTGGSIQKLLSESTETTKLNREIQDNSIVNSIALTDMDKNGPSRMKDVYCEEDFTEMVVEKAHLTLEAHVQLLNEENIIVADNDDAAAQMTSHTEISTFHASCEEVTENSNICENEVSPEKSFLAAAFAFDDPTDLKIDPEVIEAEAKECIGPKADILDLDSEHNGVCAQENPGPVEPEFTNDVSLPLGCEHGTDRVAPSPCHVTDTEKTNFYAPVRCSEIENTQTEYDLNEDTTEKSGAPKNSSGYNSLGDQCQSDEKDGAETSEEKLIVSNVSGDNMSMEKTIMGGEREATKQAEEISIDYTSTLAYKWNCSKENEDSIEAVNELELGRRLSEGNFPDIMVAEIQNEQIGKEDIITLNGPNDDSCQGTKMSNLETSMNKSTVTGGVCSSIQNEELNMGGGKESECENSINKSSLSEQEENELPVKFEAHFVVDESSGSESILRNKTCDEDFFSVKDNIVIEYKELSKDGDKENECEKSLTEISVSEREEHSLQSLFATPIKSVDSCMVDEASGLESILKATSIKEDVCTVKENVVTETICSDRIERGRGLIFEATDHEVLDTGCIAGTDETDLRLLFATPNKMEAFYKIDGFCCSESKLEESCLEKVCSAKQKASHNNVGEAGYHDDTECIARNDESDLQVLFTTPNKSFSREANIICGSESKHTLDEECNVENVCPMKQNTSHKEVGMAGFELTNSLSPEAPYTEALVDTDFLDNLTCAPESCVNCEEQLAQSSENFDTCSKNQIQVSVATSSDNLNRSREKEESVDERTVDVELCIDAIEKLEVTSLSEGKFHDTVVTEIQDQDLLVCNITTNVGGQISEEELGKNGQENELLLFATPKKSEASCEANETCGFETKLQESCMEKASCDKVGDAISDHEVVNADCIEEQYEFDLQLMFATPSTMSVEHILSSGQTYLDEEPKNDDLDSAKIISTMASPLKNRNESCDGKLLDIESAENPKLAQSTELVTESGTTFLDEEPFFSNTEMHPLLSGDDDSLEILKESDVMETIQEYTNYESSN